ncbi:MAG: hypothetical protein ACPGID_00600 [Rubricella sp.]
MPPTSPPKGTRAQTVYTLVVELGRVKGDGLPEKATGGGMVLYAPGRDEEEAVRDAVRLLKEAGLNPLEVTANGSIEEQEAEGAVIAPEERALMEQALAENGVVVASKEAFYD